MADMNEDYLPCRVCGKPAYVPEVVVDGNHCHHQACCNQCGIEVIRLTKEECRDTWNAQMNKGQSNQAALDAAVAAERERCASLCERARPPGGRAWSETQRSSWDSLTYVAKIIRAGVIK